MFKTYQPSGRVSLRALPILLIGIAIVTGAGWLYQFLLHWIPFIYLNFLLTVGMGMVIGFCAALFINLGHVRNVFVGFLFGVVLFGAGLSAKYWFQYRTMINQQTRMFMQDNDIAEDQRNVVREEFAKEITFWKHLELRVNEGWAIGRGGGGAPVSGILVVLVWIAEAGVLFFIGTAAATSTAREPYSEKLGRWAETVETIMELPVSDDEMVDKIRTAISVDQLLDIPIPKSDQSLKVAHYTINSIEGHEREDAYLSVELVTTRLVKEGAPETESESLVKYAILSSDQRDKLFDNASLLNEALADYRAAVEEETFQEEDAEEADYFVSDEDL